MIPCEEDVPALGAVSCSSFALKAAAIAADGDDIPRLIAFDMIVEEVMNTG